MAHQAHNIPWHILANHYQARLDPCDHPWGNGYPDRLHVCPEVRLFSLDKAGRKEQLAHFVRCFVRSIREFAATERAKFPAKLRPPPYGTLNPGFAERYIAQQEHPLSLLQSSLLQQAIDGAQGALDMPVEEWLDDEGYFGVPASLAYIKLFLDAGELGPMLAIAQHPEGRNEFRRADLADLDEPQTGWLGVAQVALAAYALLNIMTVFREVQQMPAAFRPLSEFFDVFLCRTYFSPRSDKMHMIPHWPFWSDFFPDWPKHHGPYSDDLFAPYNDALRQTYLDKCFRMMYSCEVIAHQAGDRIEWEAMLLRTLGYYLGDNKLPNLYDIVQLYTEDYRKLKDRNRNHWRIK